MNELSDQDKIFYPNPTNGNLYFNLPNSHNSIDAKIEDLNGSVIYHSANLQNNNLINLSSYEKGMYLLTLIFDDQLITEKIILK